MEFIAQIEKVYNTRDGGYRFIFVVGEDAAPAAAKLLTLFHGKNLKVCVSEE